MAYTDIKRCELMEKFSRVKVFVSKGHLNEKIKYGEFWGFVKHTSRWCGVQQVHVSIDGSKRLRQYPCEWVYADNSDTMSASLAEKSKLNGGKLL